MTYRLAACLPHWLQGVAFPRQAHLKSYTTEKVLYMLKLTKKADYGLIAMRHLALQGAAAAMASASAKDIADEYGIPQQALAKILQRLAKSQLLISHHGTNGGYSLARPARSLLGLGGVKAIDGPLFMTACSTDHDCVQSSKCTVREPLRKVSEKIQEALERVKLADMGGDESQKPAAASPSIAELVRLT